MAQSLYELDGEHFVPTELSRGPWSPDALHGGPVAALVAHLAETPDAPGPMHPARLTLELLRPVPLAPLRPEVRILRPGRKVQLVGVSLFGADLEVARATVLRLRTDSIALPRDAAGGNTSPPPGPERAVAVRPAWRGELRAYHSHATEHRIANGSWEKLGPCTDWVRVLVPLAPGIALSPFARVAAAADFGNGISAALPFDRFRFLNADLTLHLHRLPGGDWVRLDAVSWPEPAGVGLAESALHDERGPLGRALQSLLLERADPFGIAPDG